MAKRLEGSEATATYVAGVSGRSLRRRQQQKGYLPTNVNPNADPSTGTSGGGYFRTPDDSTKGILSFFEDAGQPGGAKFDPVKALDELLKQAPAKSDKTLPQEDGLSKTLLSSYPDANRPGGSGGGSGSGGGMAGGNEGGTLVKQDSGNGSQIQVQYSRRPDRSDRFWK